MSNAKRCCVPRCDEPRERPQIFCSDHWSRLDRFTQETVWESYMTQGKLAHRTLISAIANRLAGEDEEASRGV